MFQLIVVIISVLSLILTLSFKLTDVVVLALFRRMTDDSLIQ